jgi:hypothetical protein
MAWEDLRPEFAHELKMVSYEFRTRLMALIAAHNDCDEAGIDVFLFKDDKEVASISLTLKQQPDSKVHMTKFDRSDKKPAK